MCNSIHTCMGDKLLRHCFSQVWVYDGDIRSDLEVCKRILDSLLVICDYSKCRYFCCCSTCRGNGTEMSLLSQFRHAEDLTHFFECDLWILIFDPHCLSSIDWRTTTHGNNPIRLESKHLLSACHNCIYRRIRLDSVDNHNFHSSFLKISFSLIKESKSLHGAASDTDDSFLSFKTLKCFHCTFSMIQISR